MTDWDDDSPVLQANLTAVLRTIRDDVRRRSVPSIEDARRWQQQSMNNLVPPSQDYVGKFRGETGLENVDVQIGTSYGTAPDQVAGELKAFEQKFHDVLNVLDRKINPDQQLTTDDIANVIDLCSWVHTEWIRIHPFANGNGRTARLWVNAIAMRYGLPPFVRLRPRPDGGYDQAAEAAMLNDWQTMVPVFRQMLNEMVNG